MLLYHRELLIQPTALDLILGSFGQKLNLKLFMMFLTKRNSIYIFNTMNSMSNSLSTASVTDLSPVTFSAQNRLISGLLRTL